MDERPDTLPKRPRNARGWLGTLRRRFVRSEFAYEFLSSTVTAYLRVVRATSRLIAEPASIETMFERHAPFVATTWHSEVFIMPALLPRGCSADVMVSRAGEGEVLSRTLRKIGFGTVRGSGATNPTRMFEKGSVAAFRGLKASLDAGRSVFLTADFDARSHGSVSPGVIALARLSQRPVLPMVAVSSNRFRARSWDRTALSLPFGRIAGIYADPIWVPRRATESELEDKRLEVERSLNAITERAYAIADRRHG